MLQEKCYATRKNVWTLQAKPSGTKLLDATEAQDATTPARMLDEKRVLSAMILDASRIVQYVLPGCMKVRVRLMTVMNDNAIIF
jgi:hypothetical protein